MSTVAEPVPEIQSSRRHNEPEELLILPDGERFELVNGRLVERNMGLLSSVVGDKIARAIGGFVEAHGLGWTPNSECGYQCSPWEPKQVRRPDASFIAADRLPVEQLDVGFVMLPPDLAVEVISTHDYFSDVVVRADEYLRAEVRLVWLIDPMSRRVYVHRPDWSVTFLGEGGELDGEDVLPGFRIPIRELFPPRVPAPRNDQSGDAG